MELEDVVTMTAFVTSTDHIAGVREVRSRHEVEGYRPTSTL